MVDIVMTTCAGHQAKPGAGSMDRQHCTRVLESFSSISPAPLAIADFIQPITRGALGSPFVILDGEPFGAMIGWMKSATG